jgi:hypothetical protein
LGASVFVYFGGCDVCFWRFWVVLAVGCDFAYKLGVFLGFFGLFVVDAGCFVDVVAVVYVS